MTPPVPVLLTLAGSDPSGGAGLQADLRVFALHGAWGTAVLTAGTAQSARGGVSSSWPVSPDRLAAQLQAAFADGPVHAAKTGMLGSAANVEAVARCWRSGVGQGTPLVVDPVLRATGGAPLLGAGGLAALREQLLPCATVLTPNLAEAAALLGCERIEPSDAASAARELGSQGPSAVVVKGGHGPSDEPARDHVFLAGAGESYVLESPRQPGVDGHGTGCLFSAAIAAAIARGEGLRAAIEHGKRCVDRGLQAGRRLGRGSVWLDEVPTKS